MYLSPWTKFQLLHALCDPNDDVSPDNIQDSRASGNRSLFAFPRFLSCKEGIIKDENWMSFFSKSSVPNIFLYFLLLIERLPTKVRRPRLARSHTTSHEEEKAKLACPNPFLAFKLSLSTRRNKRESTVHIKQQEILHHERFQEQPRKSCTARAGSFASKAIGQEST